MKKEFRRAHNIEKYRWRPNKYIAIIIRVHERESLFF